MRLFDWIVVLVYIVWIVYDGLRRSKGTDKVDGYLLANRSLPWWAVVGRGAVRYGDADERRHDGRDNRPGICDRPAVRADVLRPAARDDHLVRHGRAVLQPRARVHGIRVSGATLRRSHALARQPVV